MPYESTITFILDTICPWTYLAFLRLCRALTAYREANPSSPASFTLKLAPYQLYPDFSKEGVDKYEWYKNQKYDGSEERMQKYAFYMGRLGEEEGIQFDFQGTVGNTLDAHRVLWWIGEEKSPEAAELALKSLYKQYFEQKQHPTCANTLTIACRAAGLTEDEIKMVVENEETGLRDVRMAIREQAGNGVDSVPYVIFEGRKRDFTLIGAKSVEEYDKVLKQVAKECV